jgi:arylsulfatase A-like enzyme
LIRLAAVLAVWFGLLAGLAESALIVLRKTVLDRLVWVGPDVLWLTPVTYAAMFLVAGLGVAGLSRLVPRALSPSRAAGVLSGLAGFALLLNYGPLHWAASLVLGLGGGAVVARFWRRREEGCRRLVRGTVLPLLGLVVLTAAGVSGWRIWAAAAARTAPASDPAGPNVLLIMLDTVRSLNLSAYGYHRPTSPALERLAQTGVRFAHAIAPAPWTLPTHASLFTGRWPHELSADWLAPLDDGRPTLAERLSARGYETAGFVGNTRYCSRETGLARGFARYEDYPVTPGQAIVGTALGRLLVGGRYRERALARVSADDINQRVVRWLDRRPGDRPFFAFLNYMDAHDPYQPPASFAGRFSAPGNEGHLEALREDLPARRWPPETVRAAVDAYDESLAYLDSRLGALLEDLGRRGILDRTLVIVTSDHGEEFGEHGLFYHGNSLYRQSLEVPLIVSWPGRIPAGRVVEPAVSLRDLAATVIDLLGPDDAPPFPGRPLSRFWTGDDDAVPEPILSELRSSPLLARGTPISRGSMTSVALAGARLILNGDGKVEVYDFLHDPAEATDLSGQPGSDTLVQRLRAAIEPLRSADDSVP